MHNKNDKFVCGKCGNENIKTEEKKKDTLKWVEVKCDKCNYEYDYVK